LANVNAGQVDGVCPTKGQVAAIRIVRTETNRKDDISLPFR
jgi:hypothetical protein